MYENINPFDMPISLPLFQLDGEDIHKVIGFEVNLGEQLTVFHGTYDECMNFICSVENNALAQIRHYPKLMEEVVRLKSEIADKDEALKVAKDEIHDAWLEFKKLHADYDAERASHAIHGEWFRKLEAERDDLKSKLSVADTAWKHWQTKCQGAEEAHKYWHDKYIATLTSYYDTKNKLEAYIEKFNLRDEQLTDLDHKYQAEVARREELQKQLDDLYQDCEVPKDIILKMVQSGLKCEAIRLVWQSFGYEFEEARQIVHRIMADG